MRIIDLTETILDFPHTERKRAVPARQARKVGCPGLGAWIATSHTRYVRAKARRRHCLRVDGTGR